MAKPTSQQAEAAGSVSSTARAAGKCKSSTSNNIVKQSSITKQQDGTSAGTTVQTIDKRKRIAANARERKRMHLLNNAYDKLRKRLVDAENKSKYDVLVQAKEYIQALTTICKNFDQQHPNQCSKMEPVQDSWPMGSASDEPHPASQQCLAQYQRSVSSELDVSGAAPSSPLSPAVTVKFDFSPQPSSVMSSSDESCFSPMSHPDSVISSCSQPSQKKVMLQTQSAPMGNQHCFLNHHTTTHLHHHSHHQQVPESLSSCSTLLSPPPSSNLSPHGMIQHDCMPTFDSLLKPGLHHHQLAAAAAQQQPLANTHDIYHQYYQTFYHIQRAT